MKMRFKHPPSYDQKRLYKTRYSGRHPKSAHLEKKVAMFN